MLVICFTFFLIYYVILLFYSASPVAGDAGNSETSVASVCSDEGLDLSQHVSESIFEGPDLDPDGEEVVVGECHVSSG